MSFNFWHITDKTVKPVRNGLGFINIDFYARVTGGGDYIPHFFFEHGRQKLNTIISRAVNRAGEHFQTVILRETAGTYYTNQKDIRKSLTLRRAYGANSFNFTLVSKGRRRSLSEYKVSPSAPRKGEKTPVYGAVKREGGLKALTQAFLMKRAGGRYFPYYRIGYDSSDRQKGKIRSYISPSIPQLMKNERNVETARIEAQRTFEKRLEHELLTQWGLNP